MNDNRDNGENKRNRKCILVLLTLILVSVAAVFLIVTIDDERTIPFPIIPNNGDGSVISPPPELSEGLRLCTVVNGEYIDVLGPVFDRGTFRYGVDSVSGDPVMKYHWDDDIIELSGDGIVLIVEGDHPEGVSISMTITETNLSGIFFFERYSPEIGDVVSDTEYVIDSEDSKTSSCTVDVPAGALNISLQGIMKESRGDLPKEGIPSSVLTVVFSIV